MFGDISPKDRITKSRIRLLLHYPFFGYLALGLELEETDQIPTMATDGKHLFYNVKFLETLTPEELTGVIAHEALHCALGHLWRQGERERQKWNYAADYAINLIVTKEGLTLPACALIDAKFADMSAEQIYELLPDPSKIQGGLISSHDYWPGNNQASSDPGQNNAPPQTGNASSGTAQTPNKSTDDIEKEWKERLAKAAHEARGRGNLPGSVSKMIEDILEPMINWKLLLRDMIKSSSRNDFRFFPPSKKHIWQNVYLPSIHGEKLEIAVAIDTSGSVSDEEFCELLAEIRGITEQFEDYEIHILLCDTSVHDYLLISSTDPWPKRFRKMGGGTSFIPVFEYIQQNDLRISALAYLTDGDGAFPDHEPEYPVLWILNNNKAEVPWGTAIKMESLAK